MFIPACRDSPHRAEPFSCWTGKEGLPQPPLNNSAQPPPAWIGAPFSCTNGSIASIVCSRANAFTSASCVVGGQGYRNTRCKRHPPPFFMRQRS
jgi:hypothetical protein